MGQRALPVPVITASPHHPQSFPAHLTLRVLWFWLWMTLGIHLFCVGPLPHLRAGLALLSLNFAGGLFFPPSLGSFLHGPLSTHKKDLCRR